MSEFWVEFRADGVPRPKGSRVEYAVPGQRRRRSADVGEETLGHWTRKIRSAASTAVNDARRAGRYPLQLLAGIPVCVRAEFWRGPEHEDATVEAFTSPPDGDKLDRALWDALTGLAFHDDAQVAVWAGVKLRATAFEPPGVRCRVDLLEPEDVLAGRRWLWGG